MLLLGETPGLCDWDCGTDCSAVSLKDRIRLEIESCAAEAVLSTPVEHLDGWSAFPTALSVDPSGCGLMDVPHDFLMLGALRVKSWQLPVTRLLSSNHWLYRFRKKGWHGLRGTSSRPLAFLATDNEGRRCIELYECVEGDSLTEGFYMPAPLIGDNGEIFIPKAAYRKCLNLMADRVSQS